MKRFFVILLAVISMVAATLTGAATTYAQSVYDNAYYTIDELRLYPNSQQTYRVVDMTEWDNFFDMSTTNMTQEVLDSWAIKQRWGVSIETRTTRQTRMVVYWTEDTSLTMDWSVNYTLAKSSTGNLSTAYFYCEDNACNDIGVANISINQNITATVASTTFNGGRMWTDPIYEPPLSGTWSASGRAANYFFYGDFNYPVDYEGEPVRDTAPVPPKTYKPEILWTVGTDARFSAVPIVTDLEIPQVTGGSMSPKILHKLYDDSSNEEIFSKADIISAPVSFNLQSYGEYRYEATYIHPGVPAAPFEQGTTFIKVIATFNYDGTKVIVGGTSGDQCTENGNEVNCTADPVDVLECVTDTAPFINFADCRDQFLRIGNILTFNTISFISIENSGCRTLGTIGDWLQLENKTVCPQMPAEVRQVVTPFITFGTMLLLVYGVIKITRSDNT